MQSLQPAFDLFRKGELEQAETALLANAAAHASDPKFYFLLAATRHRMGQLPAALADIEQSLDLDPDNLQASSARAQILFDMGRREQALDAYARALHRFPDDVQLLTNLAIVYEALNQPQQALENYSRALRIAPRFRDARLNRAVLLSSREQWRAALADYGYLLDLDPGDSRVLANRADLLLAMGQLGDALQDAVRALGIDASDTQARFTHALILATLGQLQQSRALYRELLQSDRAGVVDCFERIGVQIEPDAIDFRLIWFWAAIKRQQICNWNDLEQLVEALDRYADEDTDAAISTMYLPFALVSLAVDPATRLKINRRVARKTAAGIDAGLEPLVERSAAEGTLHIAYMSGNFREHPNAYLIRRLFELHDRTRFRVSAYSLCARDDSQVLADIVSHCDSFVELASASSREVAARIRADGVQILIDLAMYNAGGRPEILAYRPAPVIASYLGIEMTSGADFVDYRISDRSLMQTDRDNWSENIVTLPESCFPYNDAEVIDDGGVCRADENLPDNAFVFCSFNNPFKIEPVVFDLWCDILRQIDGSVLWLLADNDATRENLRRAARQRGVDPGRLIFCERKPHAQHLARHRLADLFLDTLWCNAHTTAVESLWAGLPLITCAGQTTASRVGASVLRAAGLPELITDSHDRYRALAIELAGSRHELAGIRARLAQNRHSCSLFDSHRSTRKLEAAYGKMWQRHRQGLPCADIDILADEI